MSLTVQQQATPLPTGKRLDEVRAGWSSALFMAPGTILMLVLFIVPIVYAFYLAFTNLQLTSPSSDFTGLSNFTRMIGDATFWGSLWTTVVFLLASAVIGQTVVGLALAVLMKSSWWPVRQIVGMIVVFAWILPEVTVAFIWYAFSHSGGTLGAILGSDQSYLITFPLVIVSLANLWRGVAFSMMIFSAGLRSISADALDAASVEGAGAARRFFSVSLPLMRPTIITNFLLVTISNLSTFTLVYVMTQGGPGTATNILPVYIYTVGFTYQSLGYAAMISLALVVLGGVFSGLYVRTLRGGL